MPILRSLRLLNAVKGGTVSGAQLQTFLTDAGRNSEFSVLLSSRGQARRMANSPLTMAAIVLSQKAIDTVFKSATKETNAACAEVVKSQDAMNTTANSAASLNTLGANTVAWNLFKASTHYPVNTRTTIAHLAGLDPVTYPAISDLIASPVAMAAISEKDFAVSAVVASPSTVTMLVANASAMGQMAGDTSAITIIAAETAIMGLVANSTIAMTEIVSRAIAMQKMASYPGSIQAIAAVPAAWAAYKGSTVNFNANLIAILANLIGVNTTTFDTMAKIIANKDAITKVAASTQAVETLAADSEALNTLAASPNLGIMLGSSIAMDVLGNNDAAMVKFIQSGRAAWELLFASSVAKGFMVKSTPMVNAIAAIPALITYLGTMSVTILEADLPDGNATSLQKFPGVPAKLLMLSAKETGIAATYSNFNFGGTPQAGATAGATLALTGAAAVPPLAHVAGYTNLTWNFQGIGVTAATVPVITYFSML